MFAVMTKKDKIEEIGEDTIEERKAKIRQGLGISHERILLMKNYCHDVDKSEGYCDELDPIIDEPITRFFMKICATSVENEDSCCLWASYFELFCLLCRIIIEMLWNKYTPIILIYIIIPILCYTLGIDFQTFFDTLHWVIDFLRHVRQK